MIYLTQIHPQLPVIILAVLVGGLVYGLRRWQPALFARLPKPLQSLGAATPLEAARLVVEAVLVAIGGHHALAKWLLPQPEKQS